MKLYDDTDPVACAWEAERLLQMANATANENKRAAIDLIGMNLRGIESFLFHASQSLWNLDPASVRAIKTSVAKIRSLADDAKVVVDEGRRQVNLTLG